MYKFITKDGVDITTADEFAKQSYDKINKFNSKTETETEIKMQQAKTKQMKAIKLYTKAKTRKHTKLQPLGKTDSLTEYSWLNFTKNKTIKLYTKAV